MLKSKHFSGFKFNGLACAPVFLSPNLKKSLAFLYHKRVLHKDKYAYIRSCISSESNFECQKPTSKPVIAAKWGKLDFNSEFFKLSTAHFTQGVALILVLHSRTLNRFQGIWIRSVYLPPIPRS